MKTQLINDLQKIISSEDGFVLTNGGDFILYPVELIVNIDDNSWYEIETPEQVINE